MTGQRKAISGFLGGQTRKVIYRKKLIEESADSSGAFSRLYTVKRELIPELFPELAVS